MYFNVRYTCMGKVIENIGVNSSTLECLLKRRHCQQRVWGIKKVVEEEIVTFFVFVRQGLTM